MEMNDMQPASTPESSDRLMTPPTMPVTDAPTNPAATADSAVGPAVSATSTTSAEPVSQGASDYVSRENMSPGGSGGAGNPANPGGPGWPGGPIPPQPGMYAPMPPTGPAVPVMPADPAAARRYALRRTVSRTGGLALAYQTIITAVSMVFGLIVGVVASVSMIVRSDVTSVDGMTGGGMADGGVMADAQQVADLMLRWTGVLSLASVFVGFLFMLIMRHRMILTREFWTDAPGDPGAPGMPGASGTSGTPGVHVAMRPAWFLTFLALIIGVQGVLILAQLVFAALGMPLVSPTSDSLDESAVTVSMWLYIGLIGPVVEEVVFRGVLMRQLKPFGRNFAIVTSALIFALFHDDVVQGVFAFLCGLVFGFVAMEYSLVWSIALHIVNNAVIGGVLSEFAASFGPTGDAAYAFLLMVVGIGALIAVWLNHGWGLREYVRINRSEPGTYRSWTSGWFLTFVIINGLITIVSFVSAMAG